MGRLAEWWQSYRTRIMRPVILMGALPAIGVTCLVLGLTGVALAGRPDWTALMEGRGVLILNGSALLSFAFALVLAIPLSIWLAIRLVTNQTSPLLRVEVGARALAEGRYDERIQLPPHSGPFSQALAGHLNGLADSLERTERARRELVANLAHELRTPLTNVQGYLEAIRDGVVEATPGSIGSVHEEVMRLVRLLEGIHQLARVDAARTRKMVPRPTDLDQVAREILDVLRPMYDAKRIRIRTDWGLAGGQVSVHEDSLAQVLRNLLRNAALYTEEEGIVHIQSSLIGGVYRFVCINSGLGIDEQDLPHIFTRFYRTARSAQAHPTGVGVGLPIARELLEAHGGRIGVESKQGWTTFWLEVPDRNSQEAAS
ncbi:MAG TPA: HAMP domain-containing sensor histidine kinase [Symbiobacteriaceae bacterium]|nr:HAMP domain-containing sensor histidine kinase [Symbiobacteriaceae bacterium]